jgi:PTH1 family peptidyl-tRNA hydrolase
MKYLIIGLGNIGAAYHLTRHNIGFQIIDQLAQDHQASFEIDRLACKATFRYKGRILYLIKPTTYMNDSGKAVHYWLQKLKISPENSLTVVDDIALPFGTLRLRAAGSSGGHNGLESIQLALGTTTYPRLRFGVGNNFARGQQAKYVLEPFQAEEANALPPLLEQASQVIDMFCTEGYNRALEKCAKLLQNSVGIS